MPLVMGIINVTPDSFSDGNTCFQLEQAIAHARLLIAQGADILDIGGESSRPGAHPVSAAEELRRVLPLIQHLSDEYDICLSIDSTKAVVMRAAVEAGVGMVNDVSACADPDTVTLLSETQLPLCLMHSKGNPLTMQQNPFYDKSVVEEINDFFQQRISRCLEAGLLSENLILDPGFGFGKTVTHNLLMIKQFQQFTCHQLPVMLGVSRKSTLGAITGAAVTERLAGGLAASVMAMMQGAAIIRTHDVAETKQALQVAQAIRLADNE